MSSLEQALAVRRGAGLFRGGDRGLISVTGEDRTRWLQGMLSNDVASLAPGPAASGCYAALLTPKGKLVADLQVLLRGDCFWLELPAESVEDVMQRLERYIIADDVTLSDQSRALARIGIEGPAAAEWLASAGVRELPTGADAVLDTVLDSRLDARLDSRSGDTPDAAPGGVELTVARFGWTGEEAFQLFVPEASEPVVVAALLGAKSAADLVEADAEALEILRIEAGVPRLGRELSEDIMPDEARLSRAISLTKGCFTGQEIVARLESRGQVNRLLVGLEFPADGAPEGAPAPGAEIWAEQAEGEDEAKRTRPIGELTSVCQSPKAGRIGLAFVRRAQTEPGTLVRVGDQTARVARLPFEAAEVAGTPSAGSAEVPPSGS